MENIVQLIANGFRSEFSFQADQLARRFLKHVAGENVPCGRNGQHQNYADQRDNKQ